ncbi:MAG: amino acid permease, partial [Stellaceae bacterium]
MPFGRGPEFWLVAGSNGAGKTTLTTAADIRDILGDLTTINPDAIAKELIASGTVPLDQVDREAVEGAERKVAECIERRENFLVETVLSTDKYLKHVRHAKEVGASTNNMMVGIKLIAILIFVTAAIHFIHPTNWHPFMPNGMSGVLTGGSIIFFTYIGFDSVSTAAEECRKPQRDLPIGIIATL